MVASQAETAAPDVAGFRPVPEGVGVRELRILAGNWLSGGTGRRWTDGRFEELARIAAAQQAHVACFQELLNVEANNFELFHRLERILGMRGLLGIVPTGQHVAVFVREPLTVLASRTLTGGIWHHGAQYARLAVPGADGVERILRVASVHLAPRRTERRLLETEELVDHLAVDDAAAQQDPEWALVAGDMNLAELGADLSRANLKLRAGLTQVGSRIADTRPIQLLNSVGFIDAAVAARCEVATTGHWPGHESAIRADRILLSRQAGHRIRAVEVIGEAAKWTDHLWLRAVVTVCDGADGAAPPARNGRVNPRIGVDRPRVDLRRG